jgi:hypothetical protein
MEMTILASLLLAAAMVLGVIGMAGLAERLPRGGRRRQRAAGATLLLAAALIARPPEALGDWFVIFALAGVVCGGLIALARRQLESAEDEDAG